MTPARALALLTLALPLAGCAELTELRERTAIQEGELARMRGELQRYQDSYYDLTVDYEALADRIESDYEVRIRSLETENTRLRTAQSLREEELERQIAALQQQMVGVQTTSAAEIQALREDSATLQNLLAQIEQERDRYADLIQEVEGDLETATGLATEAQQSERELRQEIASLRADLSEAQAQTGGLDARELSRISSYLQEVVTTAPAPQPSVRTDPDRGVIVTYRGEDLFESGSTAVADGARASLVTVGQALRQLPETRVEVVGHTDNEPVRNMPFRDNWQVSAARAESAARVMLDGAALPEGRVRFVAAGEHQPIASNSDLEGRRANRRVEIVVVPAQ